MKLAVKIALRFLRSNPGQTVLIVLGIGIGVSVQIFIGSLIEGLQKSLIDKTIGNSPHIIVETIEEGEEIDYYQEVIDSIQAQNVDTKAIVPVSDHPAFIQYEDINKSLLIRGFDFNEKEEIYQFDEKLVEGSLPQKGEILLGITYKDKYDLKLDDEITLLSSNQKMETYTVSGFFDFKVASVNESWGVMDLKSTWDLFDTKGKVTGIEIQLPEQDVFLADVKADEFAKAIDQNELQLVNWKVQNEQLLSGLEGQSISSLMIQVFVLISVVLGIASVLAITVMQKSRQIGILKAMGLKNIQSSLVFLFEGLFLGVLGGIAGVLLGLGLAYSFTKFALNADGTPVIALYINPNFILISALIAVFSCVIASLIPARKSSKLNPIDIIRNN